jgi:hypothetical protein
MTAEDLGQRSIAEHVLWCGDKRDALAKELVQYQSGALSIGIRKAGEPVTQGTLTHIIYLQRTIEQLGRVIAAYSPPNDQTAHRQSSNAPPACPGALPV